MEQGCFGLKLPLAYALIGSLFQEATAGADKGDLGKHMGS